MQSHVFNHNMQILTFKVPAIRQVWEFILLGDYAFSFDQRGACMHIPAAKHHHFLVFSLVELTLQMEDFAIWAGYSSKHFTSLILFLCQHKGFNVIISLDDILVLIHSGSTGKRACFFVLFMCSSWIHIFQV